MLGWLDMHVFIINIIFIPSLLLLGFLSCGTLDTASKSKIISRSKSISKTKIIAKPKIVITTSKTSVYNMKTLFSHQKHHAAFENLKVSCTTCHNFGVKPLQKGPLGDRLTKKILIPSKDICHKCHMTKVMVPRQNQCRLCHINPKELRPLTHKTNWMRRHGNFAALDELGCIQCHKKQDCSDCHLNRDNMNPKVHRGNFRLTHAIEARMNPGKCIICHQSGTFCIDCHRGKK